MTDLTNKLGRRLFHDPRSRAYVALQAPELRSVRHRRISRPYDQQEGSCTGQMMAGMLMTEGLRPRPWRLYERQAKRFYSYATTVDPLEGSWPPEDTGSSTLAAAKAAKHYGYISEYRHAFGIDEALAALVVGPVGIGTLWYRSMFDPEPDGEIRITPGSPIVGGHAYESHEIYVERERVWIVNSWSKAWGVKGRAWLSFATLDRLLREDGECLQVAPLAA